MQLLPLAKGEVRSAKNMELKRQKLLHSEPISAGRRR